MLLGVLKVSSGKEADPRLLGLSTAMGESGSSGEGAPCRGGGGSAFRLAGMRMRIGRREVFSSTKVGEDAVVRGDGVVNSMAMLRMWERLGEECSVEVG